MASSEGMSDEFSDSDHRPGSSSSSQNRQSPSVDGERSSRIITEMPAIFADSGWDKLNNTVLSTSNCGNPALRQFGFGPTSGDGFGIGYIIKDDSISICASSKHRQTKRFIDSIEAYLLEIRKLLRVTRQRTSEYKASRAREAEDRHNLGSRHKTQGKIIHAVGTKSPETTESKTESDDEDLGGCRPPLHLPIEPMRATTLTGLPSPPQTPPLLKAAIEASPPISVMRPCLRRSPPKGARALH